MSNLLIDEQPLVVLPNLAKKVGLNEAIVLQQFHYWLQRTNNVQNGKKWTYNTYDGLLEQMPFFSKSTLRRAITSLEKMNLVETGNFNKKGFDKTKWYTINYDAIDELNNESVSSPCVQNEQTTCSKRTAPTVQNEHTNTRDYPETTTENMNNDDDSGTSGQPNNQKQESKPKSKSIFSTWQEIWGFPNAVAQQDIQDWVQEFGEDLVRYAISEAARYNINSRGIDKYLLKVMRSYRENEVTTVEQAQKLTEEHKQRISREMKSKNKYKQSNVRETLPNWANHENNTEHPKFTDDDIPEDIGGVPF